MNARRVHFDPGLQPERTSLAWRRTVLSIAAGSLVSTRLLHESLGLSTFLVSIPLVVAAVCSLHLVHCRHTAVTLALTDDEHGSYQPDGRLHAAASALTVLIGMVAAVYVLTR